MSPDQVEQELIRLSNALMAAENDARAALERVNELEEQAISRIRLQSTLLGKRLKEVTGLMLALLGLGFALGTLPTPDREELQKEAVKGAISVVLGAGGAASIWMTRRKEE